MVNNGNIGVAASVDFSKFKDMKTMASPANKQKDPKARQSFFADWIPSAKLSQNGLPSERLLLAMEMAGDRPH